VKAFWGEAAGLRYVQVEAEDASKDLPVIVAIHGRGADATDLAGLAPAIHDSGYRWLFPQGPRPVPLAPGYTGWAWYELGDQQSETVLASRDVLVSFIDEQISRLGSAHNRMLLLGFSQGAVMAMHVGLAAARPFAGIAAMSGYLPAANALEDVLADRRDRSLLMVHGTADQTLSIDLGRRARDYLVAGGLAPEYVEFDMGHQITDESLTVVREYIHRVLPPGPGGA
jgi:phospholipase/carboxylesterase